MKASISIGEYTTNPYCVTGLEIPVYCIEELCYLMKENALLLDQSLLTKDLVNWIESECILPELAAALRPMLNRHGSLSAFVCTILDYVGLYDLNTLGEIRKVLKIGAGLSGTQRHKNQVDYLVTKKKYGEAIKGYVSMIAKWEKSEETGDSILPAREVLASIWHNLGVAYTGLMSYEAAAESFMTAYKIDGEKEHLRSYLAAYRMLYNDDEFIAFASDKPELRDAFLELEHQMEQLRKNWPEHPDAKRLIARRQLRDYNDFSSYNNENEMLLRALKEEYRDMVSI